jgi:protein phosphatase 1 regulatory subunit 3A/B/C/D/E
VDREYVGLGHHRSVEVTNWRVKKEAMMTITHLDTMGNRRFCFGLQDTSAWKRLSHETIRVDKEFQVEIDCERTQCFSNSSPVKTYRGILKKNSSEDLTKLPFDATKDDLDDVFQTPNKEIVDQNYSKSGAFLNPSKSVKKVSFADVSPERRLVEVRKFTPSDDDLNTWSASDFFKYHYRSKSHCDLFRALQADSKAVATNQPINILLCFPDPSTQPHFKDTFERQNVALEKCGARERSITGLIILKNLDFKKRVFIRYTVDSWQTYSDTDAAYLPVKSSPGDLDRFMFTLHHPKKRAEMEFCICYVVRSQQFWDNNLGNNYKVKDVLLHAG